MKNINIPPHITLIAGIVLVVIGRAIFVNTEAVIPQAVQALGVILVLIGLAGLVGRLFRKK